MDVLHPINEQYKNAFDYLTDGILDHRAFNYSEKQNILTSRLLDYKSEWHWKVTQDGLCFCNWVLH